MLSCPVRDRIFINIKIEKRISSSVRNEIGINNIFSALCRIQVESIFVMLEIVLIVH